MDDKPTGQVRLTKQGDRLEHAVEVLEGEYSGVHWQADLTDVPFQFRYAAAGDDVLTLRSVLFTGRLRGEMPPQDDIVIQWINTGRGVLDVDSEPIELTPGRPRLWPEHAFRFDYTNYEQRLVHVNRAAVEKMAAERGLAPSALEFDHTIESSPAAMQMWRNSVSLISRSILDRNASPLLQAEMGRLAGMALLELYPQGTDKLPVQLLLPRNARTRAAIDFINANLDQPISPVDVAAAAELSPRGLQQAFSRLFDLTPHGYIRKLRLDKIYEELLSADPETATIAGIALRWGFAHAGRFSAAYAAEMGEYPKDTLHRHRKG